MRRHINRVSISALGLTRSRLAPVALALALAGSVTLVDGARPAAATHSVVTSVQGSAFGYHADDIALFGGAQPDTGPTPTVALASDASNSPVTATAATGSVQYGPATLFTSGLIEVASSGTLGPTGSVTGSTALNDVDVEEILTADLIESSCSASTSGATAASASFINGTLTLDNGVPGDHEPLSGPVSDPPPNTSHEGHTHIGDTQERFRVILNEQVFGVSSVTVNAVHVIYLGPTLTGELIIGQAVCGVTTESVHHPPDVQPVGDIGGPCADPAYYGIFDNTASSVALKFRFRWYTRMGRHTVRKTVPAGAIFRTWEKWVKPFTTIRVAYKNPTTGKWVNLASEESVKGTYPPCEYKRGFEYPTA